MKNNAHKAYGKNYFASMAFPLAVRDVPSASTPQHEHDLTEINHYHNFSELVIITRGQGIQIVNGVEYQVAAGDVFLLNGFSSHKFKNRQTQSHINIMFAPERLQLPEDSLRKIPGYNIIFKLEPSLRSRTSYKHRLNLTSKDLALLESMTRKLKDELQAGNPGFEAAALALLLEVIVFISRKYDSEPERKPAALIRVGNILSRIESDYAKQWTLKDLAKLAAMSPNNLLLLFKAATGSSPVDYLIKVRLRNAAEGLRTSRESISSIAYACGFRDSNYFSKKFRDIYGISPRQYRDKFFE